MRVIKNTSGTTAVATTDDSAVALLAASTELARHLVIINEGDAPGFFSDDGGTTWARLPTGTIHLALDPVPIHCPAISVKRESGGTNLSGLFAFAW